MRQHGSILLISCYELGHQPLGLASPLGFLRRTGFAPLGMDIAREEFNEQCVARARFVGISVPMHTALRLGVQAAQRVRSINPDCHICFYGLYAPLNTEYLLDTCADSIVGGEYEAVLVNLVEALAEERPIHRLEGLVSRQGLSAAKRRDASLPDMAPSTGSQLAVLRRLDFAAPSRDGLPPLEKYARLERDGRERLTGYVEASRGCLHLCLHCPIPSVYDGRFFVVPKPIVLEDIRALVRAGAEHITYGDPDFLNGPKHSLGIVRAMHDEFPDVSFDITTKVEHILKHAALMPELVAHGCVFVVSAVESLSDVVLAHLEKGHTRADVFRALEILRSCGLPLRSSWVSFTPWTTLDDYLDVLDFVAEQGLIDSLDPVHYAIRLLVPPGSGLLSRPAIQPFLTGLDQVALTYRWTHPDPTMHRLYENVSALVEEASRTSEDAADTFQRVRELAFGMHADRRPAGEARPLRPDRSRPPRLTEPWFCCAEPTADQFRALQPSVSLRITTP